MTVSASSGIFLALLQLPGIGRKTVYQHISVSKESNFSPSAVECILKEARSSYSRIREYSSADIASAMEKAERIVSDCSRLGIAVTSYLDPDYPKRLFASDDPPVILFSLGDISVLNRPVHTVAVIGVREPTEYGSKIAVRFGEVIAEAGMISVSGLALGCDTGGHIGTVNRNGISIAVLGCGLDSVYPESNTELARRILECGGCLISEYPPYAEVQKGFFVERDRLQAALSDAVIVAETPEQDGTMHTVAYAEKYGKRIYCSGHPEKYRDTESVKGNWKLISEGRARGIYTKEDMDNLISEVEDLPFLSDAGPALRPAQLSFL